MCRCSPFAWGVGQIGLPFSESGFIKIFGFSLPLQADSTIIASVWRRRCPSPARCACALKRSLPAKTKPPARSAALATVVTMARGFTAPLGDNSANNALKELLKTAEVSQHGERVVVTATLPSNFFTNL